MKTAYFSVINRWSIVLALTDCAPLLPLYLFGCTQMAEGGVGHPLLKQAGHSEREDK